VTTEMQITNRKLGVLITNLKKKQNSEFRVCTLTT
jgi:hypothetical protein